MVVAAGAAGVAVLATVAEPARGDERCAAGAETVGVAAGAAVRTAWDLATAGATVDVFPAAKQIEI